MARIKAGKTTRKRHKKVIKQAKDISEEKVQTTK